MKSIETEVLVIGGGATGTGVVRDLAMRGFKTILVERRDFTQGTTGRFHGLLHSGGRYVVKDPQAALECITENRILRRIMPHCIEDTGGFFVLTPWDDPRYSSLFKEGCQNAGIPLEEVPIAQMMLEEPLLNPQILQCYRVPDGSADSFLAAHANVESAKQYGAMIWNYHPASNLIIQNNRVIGAICQDLIHDEEVHIHADCIVNATGAWTGKIAQTIGIPIKITPGKGVMIAVNHRIVNTIINRCRMPADGDILVPAHTVAVMGTTDVKVEDPDHFAIEPWEINLMLEEGEKLVPGFKDMRMLRAWAGVRPLYEEINVSANRDVTRVYVLLDHSQRDGVDGLITITSGKWTTYRKMAEVTVDLVCEKLGVVRPCRTHIEALPKDEKHGYHYLGQRLSQIEKNQAYGRLICECELATVADVRDAIIKGEAKTFDDIRRDVRLGMGPCQGGFCTLRAAGMLHELRNSPVTDTNAALRDFLQERWKGSLPILWGQQLRQQRLDELIFRSLLNVEQLPGPKRTHLMAEVYAFNNQVRINKHAIHEETYHPEKQSVVHTGQAIDVLVVGIGLAGLVTGWQIAASGKKVQVIGKGWGTTHWHTGCIDVLGNLNTNELGTIRNPHQGINDLQKVKPSHPYAMVGEEVIKSALDEFLEMCNENGYPLRGSLDDNWLLPTALGSLRPTCFAPETMIAGDMRRHEPILVVGFEGYYDFFPDYVAANLSEQGISASGIKLQLPSLQSRKFITSRVLADLFDTKEFRQEVIHAITNEINASHRQSFQRIGFPAVLGLREPLIVKEELENQLGSPVFEIPTLPPSIPGIRLQRIIVNTIEKLGGHVMEGMQVIGYEANQDTISSIYSETPSRSRAIQAAQFVLATGGILGGGITSQANTHPYEIIFNLPLSKPADSSDWFKQEFLSDEGHPLFQSGVIVNRNFQPVDHTGKLRFNNLYAVGNAIGGFDIVLERSLEGVALVSGYKVGKQLAA